MVVALPIPLMVRKLVPSDAGSFSANPQAYAGGWQSDEEGKLGAAYLYDDTHQLLLPNGAPVVDENGNAVAFPCFAICWEDQTFPVVEWVIEVMLENVGGFEQAAPEYEDEAEESTELRSV